MYLTKRVLYLDLQTGIFVPTYEIAKTFKCCVNFFMASQWLPQKLIAFNIEHLKQGYLNSLKDLPFFKREHK